MPTNPTPPSPDARDAQCARGLHFIRLSDMRCTSCGGLFGDGPRILPDPAALSAFRAACVALVALEDAWLPRFARYPSATCRLCDCVVATAHAPTCPVALARVAVERWPEDQSRG